MTTTGLLPFKELNYEILLAMVANNMAEIDWPEDIFLEPEFRDVVEMCITYDPEHRPPAASLLEHNFITGSENMVTPGMDLLGEDLARKARNMFGLISDRFFGKCTLPLISQHIYTICQQVSRIRPLPIAIWFAPENTPAVQ